MRTRLTALDSSFLRVESASAHMHVAWVGLFDVDDVRGRPMLAPLRRKVAARMRHLPRFRQRLAFPPLRMGEPFWVDDPGFDVCAHVTALSRPGDPVSPARFRELTDAVLSEPLDRERPLWHIHLVPRLEDGRAGVVCKLHHAMVDGKSAVEVALLLFDSSPESEPEAPDAWSPPGPPNGARLAFDTVVAGTGESLRAVRDIARMAGPGGGSGLAGTLRRAALAVEKDLLRPAPPSYLNVPIGPQRTLVCHGARMSDILRARRGKQVTVNDVCLAAVAGALRELALTAGRQAAAAEGDGAGQRARRRRGQRARKPDLVHVHRSTGSPSRAGGAARAGPPGNDRVQALGPRGRHRARARRAGLRPAAAAQGRRGANGGEPADLQPHRLEHPRPLRARLHARRRAGRGLPRRPARRRPRAFDRHVQLPGAPPLRPVRRPRRATARQ